MLMDPREGSMIPLNATAKLYTSSRISLELRVQSTAGSMNPPNLLTKMWNGSRILYDLNTTVDGSMITRDSHRMTKM